MGNGPTGRAGVVPALGFAAAATTNVRQDAVHDLVGHGALAQAIAQVDYKLRVIEDALAVNGERRDVVALDQR